MHTFTSAYAAPLSFPTAVSTENSPDKPERSVQSATSVGSRKSSFSRQATSTATVAVKGQQVSVYVSEQLKKVTEGSRVLKDMGIPRRYRLKEMGSGSNRIAVEVVGGPEESGATVYKSLNWTEYSTELQRLLNNHCPAWWHKPAMAPGGPSIGHCNASWQGSLRSSPSNSPGKPAWSGGTAHSSASAGSKPSSPSKATATSRLSSPPKAAAQPKKAAAKEPPAMATVALHPTKTKKVSPKKKESPPKKASPPAAKGTPVTVAAMVAHMASKEAAADSPRAPGLTPGSVKANGLDLDPGKKFYGRGGVALPVYSRTPTQSARPTMDSVATPPTQSARQTMDSIASGVEEQEGAGSEGGSAAGGGGLQQEEVAGSVASGSAQETMEDNGTSVVGVEGTGSEGGSAAGSGGSQQDGMAGSKGGSAAGSKGGSQQGAAVGSAGSKAGSVGGGGSASAAEDLDTRDLKSLKATTASGSPAEGSQRETPMSGSAAGEAPMDQEQSAVGDGLPQEQSVSAEQVGLTVSVPSSRHSSAFGSGRDAAGSYTTDTPKTPHTPNTVQEVLAAENAFLASLNATPGKAPPAPGPQAADAQAALTPRTLMKQVHAKSSAGRPAEKKEVPAASCGCAIM